jgi:hypothetical protein
MSTFTQATSVDRIEVLGTGMVQVRLQKQVLKDDVVIASEYHRTTLAPGDDTAMILTTLNVALTAAGSAAVTADAWSAVSSVCAAVWTDAVIAAYKASLAS